MSTPFTGHCLCGSIRYERYVEKPAIAGNCYCRDCQRSSGSANSPAMFFPRDAVKITGDVKWYDVVADSGNPFSRGFCPTCGSNMFGKSARLPDLIGIRAGTLDDPARFEPSINIFVASAPPWHMLDPGLPRFDRAPPPA